MKCPSGDGLWSSDDQSDLCSCVCEDKISSDKLCSFAAAVLILHTICFIRSFLLVAY